MRIKDLLSEERAAVPPKPRNFVAKNAKMGGAGQHKDKKKAEKQGDVKHKKDMATMEAFQNDEANIMYRFNPETGLLGQRMIHNDEERVAHQQGYRDSHEAALRVHGIIRSKYDPKKFVQKQGNSWPEVFPYGKKNEGVAEGKITLSTDPSYYGAIGLENYKATGPVVNIPANQLVGFEPDDKMNQPKSKANVEKIVAGLKQGDKLPPLLVRKYKNGYQVLDGHHRFWAYKLLGVKSIPAQIVPDSDIEEIRKKGVAEGLDHNKRQQLIQFLVKKLDWEANYLELATDAELIKWYKNVQAGKKPMGY